MEGEEHKKDLEGRIKAAERRTSITGSPVEQFAFRFFLTFLTDDQFAKVSVSPADLSILVLYSWAIPKPAQPVSVQLSPSKKRGPYQGVSPLPRDAVLNALKSSALRQEYYQSMVKGYDFDTVKSTLDRLLNQLADLGVEGARVLELDDLAGLVIDDRA